MSTFARVPVLTIPESSYDLNSNGSTFGRKSRLFLYLLNLTHGSAIALVLGYILGFFVLKPLLATKAKRRLELLEEYRHKTRDLYLSLIGKVSYIPIVAINKNDGSGKLFADAICQTDDSYLVDTISKTQEEEEEALNKRDTLGQEKLVEKLSHLFKRLDTCTSYSISEIPHYSAVDHSVKTFQKRSDSEFFNALDLYAVEVEDNQKKKKKDLVAEAKNEIRSLKGMYMSGQI